MRTRAALASAAGLFCLLSSACLPDTTGTGGGGGLGEAGAGDGGSSDGAPSVDPQRASLCAEYGQATAQCCAGSPGECTMVAAADWQKYCVGYATRCPAMPTCFSGGDCNTLIYCGGGC